MKKWVLLLLSLVFLSACHHKEEAPKKSELCGYGPMMVINGKQYLRLPVKKSFKLDKELGKIQEKIDEKFHPEDNFFSNTLEGFTIIIYDKLY
jgi:hypothetical protein